MGSWAHLTPGLVPGASASAGWLARQLHGSALPASATLSSLLQLLPSKMVRIASRPSVADDDSRPCGFGDRGTSTSSPSSAVQQQHMQLSGRAIATYSIPFHPQGPSSRLYASLIARQSRIGSHLRSSHSLVHQQRGLASAAGPVPAALSDASESDSEEQLSAEQFRAKHSMHVISEFPVPDPAQTFDDARFPAPLLRALKQQGFASPSAIQAQAWPVALLGQDLVAIAATGSGKTLGFLLPAFVHIKRTQRDKDPSNGPTVLVVAPTRELAQQIHGVAQQQGRQFGLRSACLVGGESAGLQRRQLREYPQIVVACPGRLLDLVERGWVGLQQVSYLVLDEADRMLDMGFEQDVRSIAQKCETQHQTLFFSATWPKEVERVAAGLCRNDPVHVFMGDVADGPVANRAIRQHAQVVARHGKMAAAVEFLVQQLAQQPGSKAMVFCNTKDECDVVAEDLRDRHGIRAAAIHGDKKQSQRDFILDSFRRGRTHVLVATDVAARGLDIAGVRCVVNYDFPVDAEMYIHRIGRTGRAGASGDSLALLAPQEARCAAQLVKVLKEAGQPVPEDVAKLARQASGSSGGGSRWGGRGGGGGYGGRGGGSRGYGGDRNSRGYGGGRGERYSDRGERSSRGHGYGAGGGRERGSSGSWRQWDDKPRGGGSREGKGSSSSGKDDISSW